MLHQVPPAIPRTAPPNFHLSGSLPPPYSSQLQDMEEVHNTQYKGYNFIIVFSHRMGQANLMATNRKDHQITKIVTTIVLVFLVLNIPRLGLGIFEISRYRLHILF